MARTRTGSAAAAVLLISLASLAACETIEAPYAPRPGLPAHHAPLVLDVPGGRVDAVGGNLLIERVLLSIDTRVLPALEARITYSSASGRWHHGFDVQWDGEQLVDARGTEIDTTGVAPGQAIEGTAWARLDDTALVSFGGLVHRFEAGRLAALHWVSAEWPRLVLHTAASGVVTIDQCRAPGACEPVIAIARDAEGRVVEIADRTGRRAELVWSAGRLIGARSALDVESGSAGARYGYDASGRLETATSPEGERVRFGWLGAGLRTVETGDPVQALHRFDYEASKGVYTTRSIDPLGGQVVHRHDADGRWIDTTDALGQRRSATWVGRRMASRTDAAGVVTRFTYEADASIELLPSGNARRTEHPALGGAESQVAPWQRPILRVEDALGLVEEREYDAHGRLVVVRNGAGEAVRFAHDDEGRVVEVVDASGRRTRFEDFGPDGHPRSVLHPDDRVEIRQYDGVGNLTSGWLAEGALDPGRPGRISRTFDAARNVASVSAAPLGADGMLGSPVSVEIEWRSDGRPLRVARPFGGDHEFVYDDRGRNVAVRERSDGEWRETAFAYDSADRLVEVHFPNGWRRSLSYDAAGRLTGLAHERGGAPEREVAFRYEASRLVERLDSTYGAPESLHYDAAGRVERVDYPRGESLALEYDVRSRPTQHRYAHAWLGEFRRIGFAWDGADRAIELRDGEASLVSWSILDGRVAETRFGNGVVRTEVRDAAGHLRGVSLDREVGGVVAGTLIDPDTPCLPQPSRCASALAATFMELSGEHVAWIPERGAGPAPRVAAWSPETVIAIEVSAESYRHDALGNLEIARGGAEPEYVWNAERSRLLEGAGHRYAYDAAGFAIERDGEMLVWSAVGRPERLGGLSFEWDSEGRLAASGEGDDLRPRLFGGRVPADAQGLPLRLDLGDVAIDLPSDARIYRHLDLRGNVAFVTDDEAELRTQRRYAAYGVDTQWGETVDDRGFAQGRSLGDGDLLMLGARVYDPEVGRFLSPDPSLQVGSQYAYTEGDPYAFWDPDGATSQPTQGQVGGAAAVAFGGVAVAHGGVLVAAGLVTAGVVVASLGLAVATVGVIAIIVTVPESGSTSGASGASAWTLEAGIGTSCSPRIDPAPSALVRWLWLGAPLQILLGVLAWRAGRPCGHGSAG